METHDSSRGDPPGEHAEQDTLFSKQPVASFADRATNSGLEWRGGPADWVDFPLWTGFPHGFPESVREYLFFSVA